MAKSCDQFLALVKDSVDGHAKRKNYTKNGADGENQLLVVMQALGIAAPHGIGEIIYKCAEYLKNPREVLLIKIAGWAFILWREHVEPDGPSAAIGKVEEGSKDERTQPAPLCN